jgi:hypothetical protein
VLLLRFITAIPISKRVEEEDAFSIEKISSLSKTKVGN